MPEEQDPKGRSETGRPPKDQVPYARMGDEQKKKEAPGIEEHGAAGQGLSG